MRKLSCFFLWLIIMLFAYNKGDALSIHYRIGYANPFFSPVKERVAPHSNTSDKPIKDTIHHKKHRAIAALLAFPLGVFGLHRMYLGTSAIVPVIYIVTFGGVFGILPFIDFVQILLAKDIHKTYTGNHHLFMWQKSNDKR